MNAASAVSRRNLIALLVIVALAFALRVSDLGRQSLWYDEGVSAYLTTLSLPALTQWTADDIQPPLYYYLLAGWTHLFGRSEAALRWPSLLFSLLSVPLAWYAGRRLFSPLAGIAAALLFAISPLHIWYAREARNYALLTFLGFLASMLMFDLAGRLHSSAPHSRGEREVRPAERWRWAAYAVVCAAALYTHYFAAFLIAFHILYYFLAWRRAGQPLRRLIPAGLAWASVVAIFAPWLPFLIGRYGADQSYWQGALKLDEALRKVLISFSLGESVLEPVGFPLAMVALAALLFAWALLMARRHSRNAALFLGLYLLVPVAGVLLLALRVPKFNPRYLMPASPAFLLILAGGCVALWQVGRRVAVKAGAGALLVFLLGSSAYADYNLYADPAFTKADFRGVAAYLRGKLRADEAILLVSGHMYPVFDYYLPGAERLLLPAERTLSTQRVLGYFDTANELSAKLAGKAGAWVVRWQDEVVDPNGVVKLLLDAAGQRQPTPSFWGVGLDHYTLPAGARLAPGAQIAHTARVNFGGKIELVGWSQPAPDEYVLFWGALDNIADDLAVSLRLVDAQGLASGQDDRRPAAYLYPTTRWKAGEVVPGRGRLPALPGIPPGDYQLEVRVYSPQKLEGFDILDQAGAAQGKVALIGPFRVRDAGRAWTSAGIPGGRPQESVWLDSVALRGAGELPARLTAGETLNIETVWQCLAPTRGRLSATVKLRPLGRLDTSLESDLLLMSTYPTDQWRPGEWLRGRLPLLVPARWPAGIAEVVLVVSGPDAGPVIEPQVTLGRVEIISPSHEFAAPPMQASVGAVAGDAIRLAGVSFEPTPLQAGQPLTVTLYWQPIKDIYTSYTVFIHLLDAGGSISAQYDRRPVDGKRPTTGWVPGEFIADSYHFAALPAGAQIAVGWYDAGRPGMPRLLWTDAQGNAAGDEWRVRVPAAP
jgi:mannosyltransferase